MAFQRIPSQVKDDWVERLWLHKEAIRLGDYFMLLAVCVAGRDSEQRDECKRIWFNS